MEPWFTGQDMTTPHGLARSGMDHQRPGVGDLMITGRPNGVGDLTTDLAGAGASAGTLHTNGEEGGIMAGGIISTEAVVMVFMAAVTVMAVFMVGAAMVAGAVAMAGRF